MTVLCMGILIGFLGLAIDVGVLFRAQRRVQTAADAAAVAAGLAYYYGGCIQCASNAAATNNGIADVSQVTTTVGPTQGSHLGSEYVEVIIQQPNPTMFMAAFGRVLGSSSDGQVNVAARAVAGITAGKNCIYALDPTAADAVDVQGSASIKMPNCVLQVNSSSLGALCTTGNANITSAGIHIVGAQGGTGKCSGSQPNAQTGVSPLADPFAGLPWPTCPAGSVTGATTITQAVADTLPSAPLTIGSEPTATTATVTCFSGSNVTFNDNVTLGAAGSNAVYVFQHGVKLGSDTIYGTVDVAGGNFAQGNQDLSLYAPAGETATYNAIALMVDPLNTSVTCAGSYSSFKGDPAPGGCLQIQFGTGSTTSLDGMIYAPKAAVYMQDNGGSSIVTAIVADEIYDKSSSLTITSNYSAVHTTSPLNQVSLVE